MIDFTKIQLTSEASSNKLLIEGTGSFNVPVLPGAGETFGSATVAHNFGTSNLLFQVAINSPTGVVIEETVLPWGSNDGRFFAYARIDTANLSIFAISSDTSGFGQPAFTVNYTYRVLVP